MTKFELQFGLRICLHLECWHVAYLAVIMLTHRNKVEPWKVISFCAIMYVNVPLFTRPLTQVCPIWLDVTYFRRCVWFAWDYCF